MTTQAEWAALAALSEEDKAALRDLAAAGVTQQQLQPTGGLKITDNYRAPEVNPETGRVNTSEDAAGLNYYADPRSPSAGKEGFYYNANGEFVNGPLPSSYYYNDNLGAMVEGKSGSAAAPGSPLSLGGGSVGDTGGMEGDDVFSNPFAEGATMFGADGSRVLRPKPVAAETSNESPVAEDGLMTPAAGTFGNSGLTPEENAANRTQFLSALNTNYATGAGTPEEREAYVTNYTDLENDLSFEERQAMGSVLATPFSERSSQITQGQGGSQDIRKWWTDVNAMRRQSPTEFEAWVASDPEMATRWFAWAGNKGQDYSNDPTMSREQAKEMAARLAFQMSQDAGYGEDGKKNGKTFAYDFDTFDDINNNWGDGDFWKIGRPATTSESPFGEILNNPIVQIAGNIVLPGTFALATFAANAINTGEIDKGDVARLIASAAPAIGAELSVITNGALSPIVATAATSAGATALNGGDLEDVLKTGATSLAVNTAAGSVRDIVQGNSITNTLNQVMPDDWAATVASVVDDNITPYVQDFLNPDLAERWFIGDEEVNTDDIVKDTSGNYVSDSAGNYTTTDGYSFNLDDVTAVGTRELLGADTLESLLNLPGIPEAVSTLGDYLNWRLPGGNGTTGSGGEAADGALLPGNLEGDMDEKADDLLADIQDPLGDSTDVLDDPALLDTPLEFPTSDTTDDLNGTTDPALVPTPAPAPAPATGGGNPSRGGEAAAALGGMLGGGGSSPDDLFELIKIRASTPAAQKLRINHLAQLLAQREFS